MPSIKKPSDRRQNRVTKDAVVIMESPKAVARPFVLPPANLSEGAAEYWHRFWESDVARVANPQMDGQTGSPLVYLPR